MIPVRGYLSFTPERRRFLNMPLLTRRYFHTPATLHPAVLDAGWSRVSHADHVGLGPHDHGPAYEICLIVHGEVEWRDESEFHTVGPGQIYITRPGEVHGGVGEVLQPAELYWCVLQLPGPRGAWGLSQAEARELPQRFAAMTSRVFAANQDLHRAFARIIDAMSSDNPLKQWRIRASVLELATSTLTCHDEGVAAFPPPSREIRSVMEWIVNHLDEESSIEELADRAGLAVSRFHERFAHETGYTPGDWRGRQRIAEAKRLLRQTARPITEIAMDTGFASSQYFATAFKRLVGKSPSAYRRLDVGPPAEN